MSRPIIPLLLAFANFAVLVRAEAPAVTAVVDSHFRTAWKRHGITPAPTVDDEGFLRRVTLDLTGRLPTPQAIRDFVVSSSPNKRADVVDALLASPEYAEHWATYWDNLLMGRLTREGFLDRAAFQGWLRERFAANKPWNEIVHALITAEGYNTNNRPIRGGGPDPRDFDARYNPAANWFLRYSRALPDLASATSKLFLGVQIQCAQCHDHKTEKWKQDDFKQFAACFSKTWPTYVERPAMLTTMVGIFRMDVKDRLITPPVEKYEIAFGSYKDYVEVQPKLLDGPEVRTWGSRRKVVADWVTAEDNPWFAKAIVNRIWGRLLGRGFVDPLDDFRSGNPPTLPEALDALAADFREHHNDLRHLLRAICATEAYQRDCVNLQLPAGKHAYWAAYPVKALEVEELFDAVAQATDAKTGIDRMSKNNYELIRNSFIQELVVQMGTDDMAEVAEPEETIPRSLMMLNGALVCGTTRHTTGFGLSTVLKDADDAAAIEELYLRTLSRHPTHEEAKYWQSFVAKPRQVVKTAGSAAELPLGAAAQGLSPEMAKAGADADFTELLKHARTAADFGMLRGKMENNADAGLYAKAFREYVATVPFQYVAAMGGGSTPREQAFEDLFWALLNSSEFLSNH
ncbi:MAG: DUF1549 domain-containing protein [Planctomycetes bacterium]|nr:DUF1549 domain-containing protein [Planctomycetota bacterium]